MLILTYFHPIIGPNIFLTVPEDLSEFVNLDELKDLLDTAKPGFFTHLFRENLKTVNYFFTIKSPWARGKEELIMITKIFQEQEPNLKSYEDEFVKFVNKIKKEIPDLYEVFYSKRVPDTISETRIQQKISKLKKFFNELYNKFQLVTIRTFGSMIPIEFLKEQRLIHIPSQFIGDMFTNSMKSKEDRIFTVYQYREGRIKVELIPVKFNRILKITLIFGEAALTPDIIKNIGLIFQKYKLPLVYTSGICQQKGNCIYEIYLDGTNKIDDKKLISELKTIEKVLDVKMLFIE